MSKRNLLIINLLNKYVHSNHYNYIKHFSTESLTSHQIKMPIISDVKDGVIDKWNKKEGDQFKAGETLCIVTLDGLTVSVDGPVAGVLSQILVKEGVHVVAGSTLAYFAHTKEEYLEYRENLRLEDHDLELLNDIHEINEIISQKPDNKILLREIKILIQQGDIEDNSEFSKKLQSLARKSDSQLLSVFEASFDGKYDRSSFDKKFFLDNAKDIIKELNEENKP